VRGYAWQEDKNYTDLLPVPAFTGTPTSGWCILNINPRYLAVVQFYEVTMMIYTSPDPEAFLGFVVV
jgi:hypothetical protein